MFSELIAINYSEKEAKFNVKKVLSQTIDYQKIFHGLVKRTLESNIGMKLIWSIETYEYGTRYGIVTKLNDQTDIKLIEPIDTTVHKESQYHTKAGIYNILEETFNSKMSDAQNLNLFLNNLFLKRSLYYCYEHDVDEFNRYYNYNNTEFKFKMGKTYAKIGKKQFMNDLSLKNK